MSNVDVENNADVTYIDVESDAPDTLNAEVLDKLFSNEKPSVAYTTQDGEEHTKTFETKEELVNTVFDRVFVDNISDNETIVILYTDETIITIEKPAIKHWSKYKRYNKLMPEVQTKQTKTKSTSKQNKTIAVGLMQNDQIVNIETKEITSGNKEAVTWLNEKIEKYYFNEQFDQLRICVDYTENENNTWLTYDMMLENGVAST